MEIEKALELMNGAYSAIGNQVVVPEADDRLIDAIKTAFTDVERLKAKIEEWKAQGMSFEQYKAFTEIHRKYPSPQYSIIENIEKENSALKKALELACNDAADEQCPHEFDLYTCDKCADCPHGGEIHTNAERDAQCWYDYYIQKAQERDEQSDLHKAHG